MKLKKPIKGNRIYFRTLSENDASEEYCRWLNDPVVNQYLETREATIEDLKKYIQEKNEKDDCMFLGIFDKENGLHIGNLKLEPIEKNKANFSILIGNKDYWGKGIGTEATKMMVDYAFKVLKLEIVDLGVLSENKGAIKVYGKAGFKIKNIEKNKIKHGSKYYDKVVMELRKESV